jgi:hypothetical protein
MKGKKNLFQVQANPGWSSQSSDSEDDHMKHRNVSSDEEDLQKAVQDLGLVVLDCTPNETSRRQLPRSNQTRKSRSKSLSNMTKRALISIFPSKKDKSKQQPKRCMVTLDDFPDVPTHEIFL